LQALIFKIAVFIDSYLRMDYRRRMDKRYDLSPQHGRGATFSPDGRFERQTREWVDDHWGSLEEDLPPLKTEVRVDASRSIISRNQSPDIPFEQSINPYRGCEHGCVYCYARPSHSYWGLSPGLDFETILYRKPDAAMLLRQALAKPTYQCSVITLGSNTDCYQPIERRYRITREILDVLCACNHPVAIITKSALVERDIDVLAAMAQQHLVQVWISITSLTPPLLRVMEPRASAARRRLQAMKRLSDAGIPVGVMVAPIIPGLNDAELESILEAAYAAGARRAGYVMLRLPHELREIFGAWLNTHYPERAARVWSLIRDVRGGKDNVSTFGERMRGRGPVAELINQRFHLARKRLGYFSNHTPLRCDLFELPRERGQGVQAPLF
jgi:DNA repair photolyase